LVRRRPPGTVPRAELLATQFEGCAAPFAILHYTQSGKGWPANPERERGGCHGYANLRGLDFETLRRAIEGRDADTLVGFYAAAEVLTVNPPT
jgi:hypothetical protein